MPMVICCAITCSPPTRNTIAVPSPWRSTVLCDANIPSRRRSSEALTLPVMRCAQRCTMRPSAPLALVVSRPESASRSAPNSRPPAVSSEAMASRLRPRTATSSATRTRPKAMMRRPSFRSKASMSPA